eukprot:312668-Amphidinium_carterae.1
MLSSTRIVQAPWHEGAKPCCLTFLSLILGHPVLWCRAALGGVWAEPCTYSELCFDWSCAAWIDSLPVSGVYDTVHANGL